MNRYELLKTNETLLTTLLENNISPTEVAKIEIYEKYKEMVSNKHKVTYVATYLADKYGMKIRAIYHLVKRFESDIRLQKK